MRGLSLHHLIQGIVLTLLSTIFVSCKQTATPILTIEGGQIQGIELQNSVVYKGIPYASAPVGNLRWVKPQDVKPWDTVYIADKFGPAPIQKLHDPNDGWYGTEFYWEHVDMSEDCLFLNIWTPKGASAHPEKKLPVAIWIHGGAFNGGWGHEVEFDGEAWAERGVILVTINYRLNIYGFLCHPLLSEEDENGVSGNYGIYDQLKAIKWVHNNITQFGGDPNNISIFGQSAGGMSVKYLCASPLAKDYISKAIIMSAGGILGGFNVKTPSQYALDAPGEDVFNLSGMYSLEDMRAASPSQIDEVLAQYEMVQKRALSPHPHAGGVLIKDDFNDAANDNNIADIPYMIGCVADDIGGLNLGIDEFVALRDSLSDKPVFVYRFDAPLPDDGRECMHGAFHSAELWYVFHTLKRSWRPFGEADEKLSNKIVDYWTNFVKYGNPNGKENVKVTDNNEDNTTWKPSTPNNPYVMKLERE